MAAKRTVGQLADEAGLEYDEALVTLWDVGLDTLSKPTDAVPDSQMKAARRALGLASKAQLNSFSYWRNRLDLPEDEVRRILAQANLPSGPGATTLPKGGVAVLRRYARHGDHVVRSTPDQGPSKRKDKTGTKAPRPLQWREIGKVRDITFLGVEEVRAIHNQLFEDFLTSNNPIDTPGTRSEDLLESACMRPQTAHGENSKYPTVEMAAAALAHSIVNNHPFWNGNKRTALVAFLVFLDAHGLVPTCNDDELFKFVLRVSQHRVVPRDWPDLSDREVLEMAEWTRSNTRQIVKGERPMKWHRLRRLLAEYDCVCDQAKGVGNRMNITRVVDVPGPFGIGRRQRRLHVQVAYGDEGREVDRDALKHLRTELWLDEEHGVDSGAFYDGGVRPVGEFILRYRRILRRLARL